MEGNPLWFKLDSYLILLICLPSKYLFVLGIFANKKRAYTYLESYSKLFIFSIFSSKTIYFQVKKFCCFIIAAFILNSVFIQLQISAQF